MCVTFLELHYYQQLGLISSETFLLAVDDPRPNIGSGSAVLNALLCVSEHLAARSGYTVCVFRNSNVCMCVYVACAPVCMCACVTASACAGV